ncbi:MAG: nucleotidyltransferase family protein [Deltaproteobacteria bacterium]|nr:nucleotidyltransferase family protein [Deltaproteobacteria bacterium]
MRALLLAAGHGTRLGALTQNRPKGLLEVGDQTILAHIIKRLVRHGFDQIAVNLHAFADQIRGQLGDGSQFGATLHYSDEQQPLGTAGALAPLQAFFADEPLFLVHYGDVLTDHDLRQLVSLHRDRASDATLLLHRREHSNSVAFLDHQGAVRAFYERPSQPPPPLPFERLVFSGVCVCGPAVLEAAMTGAKDLPADIFPRLARQGRLFGQALNGFRIAVDSPARLELARQALASGQLIAL